MRRALVLLLGTFALAACGPDEAELAANRDAAIDVVEGFGTRIVYVSKLAPPDSVEDQIRDQYGPYVTTLLLGGWLTDPASAPGREVSSPWPARIEVRDATPVGSTAVDVEADVVYVTSVDGDAAMRRPVSIRVVRGRDGTWRIAEWLNRS
ncbi:MAG TPA: hypothetical protein VF039_03900 [Longimicrobiales bacterium]